jgi:hypothetical protein
MRWVESARCLARRLESLPALRQALAGGDVSWSQDVTPHHLRFRSAGGSDEPDNLAAVCTWCHLLGIHEGRIRVVGPAGRARWELGRGTPCLVVEGRERLTA